jgi:hypothetical protein
MVLFGGEAEERPGGDMCSVGDALVSYGPHLDFGPLPLSGFVRGPFDTNHSIRE